MPASRPVRRALVVGINRYQQPEDSDLLAARLAGGAGADLPALRWTDLLGAVPDARDFHALLTERFDFEAEHCALLLNEEATREGIRQALETVLIETAEAGDELVFYYSGHGSRVPNSLSPDPDGMDESLVPSDSARGAFDLRDKELRRWLYPVLARGARLTAILDSCHSGSALRGLPGYAARRGVFPDTRDAADPGPWGPTLEEAGALVISACQDFQGAWETSEDGRPRGAFSRALFRVLAEGDGDESVEALFLRTRALLQLGIRFQEPVLGGPPERRREGLFRSGRRSAPRRERKLIAVGRVESGGTLQLQGGWVHGLSVGAGLLPSRRAAGAGRVQVTEVLGPVSATGRQVEEGAEPLAVGDLLEVDVRQVAVESPLRVFVPTAGESWRRTLARVEELRRRAEVTGLGWAEDPVTVDVGAILSPDCLGWRLTGKDGRTVPIASSEEARRVVETARSVGAGGELFVGLPAPAELSKALGESFGGEVDAVELVDDPGAADYLLVGRLGREGVEFAWVRPEVITEDDLGSTLPLRTDWLPGRDADCPGFEGLGWRLRELALRLAKIRAWLTLESAPEDAWAYRLTLESGGQDIDHGGELLQGDLCTPVLVRSEQGAGRSVEHRWIYVLTLDGFGRVQLRYPVSAFGGVENRFPLAEGEAPEQIRLPCGRGFRICPPFGIDTFLLLTSAEALPNPWILESEGVRLRSEGGPNALERLLTGRGATLRGSEPVAVPKAWSLERMSIRTRGRVVGDVEMGTVPGLRMRAPM